MAGTACLAAADVGLIILHGKEKFYINRTR